MKFYLSDETMSSTAAEKQSTHLKGAGSILFSSPALYFPVFTRYPRIPKFRAPPISSSTSY